MRHVGRLFGCTWLAWALAASCTGRSPCAADQVPHDGECRTACNNTTECARTEECTDGVCMPVDSVRDGSVRDASVPDSSVRDSGVPDSSVRDSGVRDSGVPDSGVVSSSGSSAHPSSSSSSSGASIVDAGSGDTGPPGARCDDRAHNGTETDVDCGGGCPGCGAGLTCQQHGDCASGYCPTGSCVALDPLLISPESVTLAVGNAVTFSASGGLAPYQFSVLSGGGTIDPTSGVYVAAPTPGMATVEALDALGVTRSAVVTVNPALQVSPASAVVAPNGTVPFTATGGVPPVVWSVPSGAGTISPDGLYTAPATAGSATVRVTDAVGNSADALLTIAAPLQVSPATKVLIVNTSFTFTASEGVPPYLWSVASGGGNITNGGHYTAPAAAGNATVRVIDSLGYTADAAVTIADSLQISPASTYLRYSNSFTFTADGGVMPYTWSVASGGGTISADGVYTAPGSSGTAIVRVTDTLGGTSDAEVTIYFPLAVQPSNWTMVVGTSKNFYASNGVSPFTWSVVSGTGSVAASGAGDYIGTFSAPSTPGSATIRVTDATGSSDATVTFDVAAFTYTQTGIIPWETSPGSPRCPCDTAAVVQNCPSSFTYADIGPKCYDWGYGIDDDDVEYTRSP